MSEKPPKHEHFDDSDDSDDSWELFNLEQHDIPNPAEALAMIAGSIVYGQPTVLVSTSNHQEFSTRAIFSGLYRSDDPLVETLYTSPQVEAIGVIVGETSTDETTEVSDKNGESITVTFTVDQDGNPTAGRFFRTV